MHEASLVRSLIRQVESIARESGAAEVSEIVVSIGPLSGVEAPLVLNAFEQISPETSVAGATITIELCDLEAVCRHCGDSFVVDSFSFQCPKCKSQSVQVTRGDEFRLVSISVVEQSVGEGSAS